MSGRLNDLYELGGQSPWIDNVRRDWLADGTMARYIAAGVRGVTSNPTIFAKALVASDDYDAQLVELRDLDDEQVFFALAGDDIRATAALLADVHERSRGRDGFVSFEVSPRLAHDAPGTIDAAIEVATSIPAPNLMVKIPATDAGIVAIEEVLALGINVNVTLIFGLERYAQVREAHLRGLERADADGRDVGGIHSVASFFVSRVDTDIDARLEKIGRGDLAGRAAVAQAKLAYRDFLETCSSARFSTLAERGASVQRPLWASTSTKNPAYPDLLYVDTLIGPDTVNTMPEATLDAFADHGTVAETIGSDLDADIELLDALAEAGIDLAEVSRDLETKGVAAFIDSYEELLGTIATRRAR